VRGGKQFKAIQIGGPSGGCIPETLLDTEVDYDSLTRAGVIMGSGGLIVLDEDDCMVDVARYFLAFLVDESCGKCTPCREGLKQLLAIYEDLVAGRGRRADLDRIESLAAAMQAGSLCELGRSAPNPVLSTLKYFRDEYLAHIDQKCCPAGMCRNLTMYRIDAEACNGCHVCTSACPAGAIAGDRKKVHAIDAGACLACGACYDACRMNAVRFGPRTERMGA
jgi:NADH-quinone oxidoreductase subunit F